MVFVCVYGFVLLAALVGIVVGVLLVFFGVLLMGFGNMFIFVGGIVVVCGGAMLVAPYGGWCVVFVLGG